MSELVFPTATRLRGSHMKPTRSFRDTMKVLLRTMFWSAMRVLSYTTPRLRDSGVKWFVRAFYGLFNRLAIASDVTLLNYGYVSVDHPEAVDLSGEDLSVHCFLRLYCRVVRPIDLSGKDLLEVGCGRGGGAAFIHRSFGTRSLLGVDFVQQAITFCQQRHRQRGLSFIRGDAENLPVPSESVDAVLNVESSHSYPSIPRFLSEVSRVLRPGGYLLIADFRRPDEFETLREQLRNAGLRLIEEEHITPNVVQSLERDSERRRDLIQKAPKFLRSTLLQFVGVKDSKVYELFRSGGLEYRRFALQKPGQQSTSLS